MTFWRTISEMLAPESLKGLSVFALETFYRVSQGIRDSAENFICCSSDLSEN